MSTLRRIKYITEDVFDRTVGKALFQFMDKKDDLFNWHYNCLVRQHASGFSKISPKYHYYEFGVASGTSLENYIYALKKFCRHYDFDIKQFHIHGFDSFEGMPHHEGESDAHPDWGKGEMSSPESVIYKKAKALGFPTENLHLYKGYYENSLTEDLRKKLESMKPALINIDCDFYSSTVTALSWVKPLMSSGTIVRFDDYWAFHGSPNHGEIRAIREFNEANDGHLASFPILGLNSYSYIYSRKTFEYTEQEFKK